MGTKKATYAIKKEDSGLAPVRRLLGEAAGQLRHEEHEDVAVSVASSEGDPDFAVGGHGGDDVDLLAEGLVRSGVANSPPPPPSLPEVRRRDPTLINVDDAQPRLVYLEHFLRVKTAEYLIAL